jgi:hypothetical protein
MVSMTVTVVLCRKNTVNAAHTLVEELGQVDQGKGSSRDSTPEHHRCDVSGLESSLSNLVYNYPDIFHGC